MTVWDFFVGKFFVIQSNINSKRNDRMDVD